MDKIYNESPVQYITTINSEEEVRQARLLIESLRSFGGRLRDCPVWLFVSGKPVPANFAGLGDIRLFPLEIDPPYRHYAFSEKVFACALAEEMAGAADQSLVWLNLDCLIINPPDLFYLGSDHDAALRPVHIRNVGSPASQPPDAYWQAVYQVVGVEEIPYSIESVVDSQIIRPYFNTHCFSINPSKGILQAWRAAFKTLAADHAFQTGACQDRLRQIFLHQVVLSALIMKSIEQERIRVLPHEYSYPLHLQEKLPSSRRIRSLNQLVCMVYEDPALLDGIEIQEPLKTWLEEHR